MSLELVKIPAVQHAVLDELKVREALTKGVVLSPVLYAHSKAKGRLSMSSIGTAVSHANQQLP